MPWYSRLPLIPLACWLVVLALHFRAHLSSKDTSFLLRTLETIVMLVVERAFRHVPTLPPNLRALIGIGPWTVTLDTIVQRLELMNPSRRYVRCQKCWKLSAFNKEVPAAAATRCDGTVDGERCGTRLFTEVWLKGKKVTRPICEFEYQSVHDWLGRLMSKPGLEDMMDSVVPSLEENEKISDFWGGVFANTFQRLGQPFWKGDPKLNEGRYIFSLAVDWFTPHQSGPASKGWSIGVVFLVCMNLPKHLRFKVENVCLVGVLPGPFKTKPHQLHHILGLVVEDFLQLWNTGVWYTRTAKYPLGRLIRAAIGPVVCDMEGARDVSGFTGFNSAIFCSYCLLQLRQIKNFARDSWPVRQWHTHAAAATQWSNTPTSAARKALSATTGVTWTPLLRLPYWNPISCTVLDPMHNLLLGLLQRHCRVIWGMDVKTPSDEGGPVGLASPPTAEEMARARHVLRTGSKAALGKLYVHMLQGLCLETGLLQHMGSPKEEMVMHLMTWVRQIYLSYLHLHWPYLNSIISTPNSAKTTESMLTYDHLVQRRFMRRTWPYSQRGPARNGAPYGRRYCFAPTTTLPMSISTRVMLLWSNWPPVYW